VAVFTHTLTHVLIYLLLLTDFLVNAVSWGAYDTAHNGYIAVSSVCLSVNRPSTIGFNFIQLDVGSCTVSRTMEFNTCGGGQSGNLANYISGLPTSTVLIGVTTDDARWNLYSDAINALLAIGVDATGLQIRGKLAFVAQIGRPTATVMRLAAPVGSNVNISVLVQGNQ